MCLAKCFYGAAAGYATTFVSLFYCSCIIFPLSVVAVPVKLVLLRVALELLPHLLSFCRCTFSFVSFLFSPLFQLLLGPVHNFFPSSLYRKVIITLCSSKMFLFLFCLLSDCSHFPYSDHIFCSLPTALHSLPNVLS